MTLYVTLYHITRSLRKNNQNHKNAPHILHNQLAHNFYLVIY